MMKTVVSTYIAMVGKIPMRKLIAQESKCCAEGWLQERKERPDGGWFSTVVFL